MPMLKSSFCETIDLLKTYGSFSSISCSFLNPGQHVITVVYPSLFPCTGTLLQMPLVFDYSKKQYRVRLLPSKYLNLQWEVGQLKKLFLTSTIASALSSRRKRGPKRPHHWQIEHQLWSSLSQVLKVHRSSSGLLCMRHLWIFFPRPISGPQARQCWRVVCFGLPSSSKSIIKSVFWCTKPHYTVNSVP